MSLLKQSCEHQDYVTSKAKRALDKSPATCCFVAGTGFEPVMWGYESHELDHYSIPQFI